MNKLLFSQKSYIKVLALKFITKFDLMLKFLGTKSNFLLFLLIKLKNLNKIIPPPELMHYAGDGNYIEVGNEFFKLFRKLCNLKPYFKILDIGCSIGRMARPLTNYLYEGIYEGFDIIPEAIGWCQKRITSKYPNFNFKLIDVYNKVYNPDGEITPSDFKFPYEDNFFNFVINTSVFTHMLPNDLQNYISEIERVLKKKDKFLSTFFIINSKSLKLMEYKLSKFDFKFDYGQYRIINEKLPELAIAYDEDYIRNLYKKVGLNIIEPIYYGNWSGRKRSLSFQDIIIAKKK